MFGNWRRWRRGAPLRREGSIQVKLKTPRTSTRGGVRSHSCARRFGSIGAMIAYHRRCDPDRHHRKRRRRTVVDPEPGRQLPEWLSRLGQLLRAIGRCAHTRDPAREAAQRSMPMGLARVRHSVLAQRPLMAKERQPHGPPMTRGNMRERCKRLEPDQSNPLTRTLLGYGADGRGRPKAQRS